MPDCKNPSCCKPMVHPTYKLPCRNCNAILDDIAEGCKLCLNCSNIMKRCRHCMRPTE